ncbi:MAG: hypothetical protein HQ534_07390 [Armatimonadetes bacterium]|nr:hypothetical protein [Armatimonadota bacterium]
MKSFKNNKFFNLLRHINRIIRKLLKNLNIKLSHEDNLYPAILLFHLSKLYSLSIVSYYLMKKKYSRESDIILRSFWETYVNLFYISQKPKIRSHQYRMDEVQTIIARNNIQVKYNDEEAQIINSIHIEEAIIELEKVKKYLMKIDSETDYEKFKWKSISVETKSRELGLSEDYDFIYRSFSKITHPSSTTGQNYIATKKDIVKSIVPVKFIDKMIPAKVLFISLYLIKTLTLIHEDFDLKSDYRFLNKKILDSLTSYFNILNSEI